MNATTPSALIAAQFGGYFIPLEKCSLLLLGLDPKTAVRYASEGRLSIPVRRLHQGAGAPWITTADDLAEHVGRMKEKEAEEGKALGSNNLLRDIRKGRK